MKKTIFGKAAMMLLIGTVALTSCSEDFVFGYDEEWDDMIPRTKWIIGDQPQSPIPDAQPEYYDWSLGNECMAQALAQSKGWNINSIKMDQYHQLIAELMCVGTWSQTIQDQYEANVRDSNGSGFTLSLNTLLEVFNCTQIITVSEYDFGSSIVNMRCFGERILDGKSHLDYITKYIPATANKPAKFVTKNYGKVSVSIFTYVYK